MDIELLELTQKFLDRLDESQVISEYKKLKKEILNDSKLLGQISKFQSVSKSSTDYLNDKQKLFQNENYKRYLKLENDIYFWTLYMSDSLKKITKGN